MTRLGRAVGMAALLLVAGEAALRLARFGLDRAALGRWTHVPPWERLRTFDAAGDPVPLPGARTAWALAPGEPVIEYRLDRFGLREARAVSPRPTAGVCRILAVGDAYTFGYGVRAADAYPARLERRLARRGAVEVLNAGFPNLNVEQERRRLERLLPVLHPALVVLSFSWWDVPTDAEGDGEGGWLPRHLEAVAERVTPWSGVAAATWRLGRHALTPLVFPPSGMARELEPLTAPPGTLTARWRRTRAAIAGMAGDAARAGATLLIVATPLDLQVEPSRRALYRWERLPYPSHGFVDRDYSRATEMPAALHAVAAELGIPLVDATPAFRAHRGLRLFLDADYHAAAAGHRLLAREVARRITREWPCADAPRATMTARTGA